MHKIIKTNIQPRPDTALKYLEILKSMDPSKTAIDFNTSQMEALLWKKKKDFPKSSSLYKKCIDESKDLEQKGECHFGLSDNYLKQGALDLAIEQLLNAIDIFTTLSKSGRLSSSYNKLGRCFDEAGYYSQAIEAFENALEINILPWNQEGCHANRKKLS